MFLPDNLSGDSYEDFAVYMEPKKRRYQDIEDAMERERQDHAEAMSYFEQAWLNTDR